MLATQTDRQTAVTDNKEQVLSTVTHQRHMLLIRPLIAMGGGIRFLDCLSVNASTGACVHQCMHPVSIYILKQGCPTALHKGVACGRGLPGPRGGGVRSTVRRAAGRQHANRAVQRR